MKWAAVAVTITSMVACASSRRETLVYAPRGEDSAASASQTWADLGSFETTAERSRVLVMADTGVRSRDNRPHPDALLVRDAAAHACAGSCAAGFFLGDNVYPRGVNEPRDLAYLRSFTDAYLDDESGPIQNLFFIQGNHDWGPLSPRRARAQALHGAIEALGPRVHGAAHFYEAEIGELRFLTLDSNFIVHHCKAAPDDPLPPRLQEDTAAPYQAAELACEKADDSSAQPLNLQLMEEWARGGCTDALRECRRRTIAVAHHPWFSNGHHGTAGFYRDYGSYSVGRGKNHRVVLENVVAPHAALYLSGHDHGVQVHHRPGDLEQLAIVVGSGGKVSPAGVRTKPGKSRHQSGMELEGFCRLGFAIVDETEEGLEVEVWSLRGSEYEECSKKSLQRRGRVLSPLGEPDPSFGHDLRCRAFAFIEGTWSSRACEEKPGSAGR